MTEEKITLSIIEWLKLKSWKIICFDFPQSGTGIVLHPNYECRTAGSKNIGSIIPDIVAYKNDTAVFFENKNRFYYDDFKKVKKLREDCNYTTSIIRLLSSYPVARIFYGVGLPYKTTVLKKANQYCGLTDFMVAVSESGDIIPIHNGHIFD